MARGVVVGVFVLVVSLPVLFVPPARAQTAGAPQTEAIWSCPVHAVVAEKAAGKCPICRRDLVPVTATVSYTCADQPGIDRPAPGKCPDGSAMERRYVQSTHANHNPRHGGLFFMAPDLWHHLEATYSQDDTFRVYLYDDYTRPLAADLLRRVAGRVVMKETFDASTRTTKELSVAPLAVSADGEYLEARLGRIRLPAELTAKLKFTRETDEYRFDFAFQDFSAGTSPAPGEPASSLFEVPDDPAGVLKLLGERVKILGDLVKKGAFGEVWLPAFQAKDLALALDVRTGTLPRPGRAKATVAVEQLVRAAWMLDASGDTGNRADVERAYAALARAAADVEAIYASAGR